MTLGDHVVNISTDAAGTIATAMLDGVEADAHAAKEVIPVLPLLEGGRGLVGR